MFPYPVITVGVSDRLLPIVRQELTDATASLKAEYGSAGIASSSLDGTLGEKHVFVVHLETAEDADAIRTLAHTFHNWPIVALVEPAGEVENVLRANRAGATQIVPVPIQPGDLATALNSIALQHERIDHNSKLIAFTGSAAGCGATTLATNVAYELAACHAKRTVLIELAQQMGVVATNLDLQPVVTFGDLCNDAEHVDAELVKRSLVSKSERFEVLAATSGVVRSGTVSVPRALQVLDILRALADTIVLDVPCTYDDFQFELLTTASQIVLVGEQSIASIRTLKLMLDALTSVAVPPRCHVVVNRYDSSIPGLRAGDLARVLHVETIHTVPNDRVSVLTSVNAGKLIRQIAPYSPMLESIDSLTRALLGPADANVRSNGRGLFRRLFHAFQN